MTEAPVQGMICTSCGGPLSARGNEVRVRCAFCGATNDIASAGAVKVAKRLDALGIRVPEKPMSIDQIHEELRERAAKQDAQRRSAIIGVVVAMIVVGLVVGLATLV